MTLPPLPPPGITSALTTDGQPVILIGRYFAADQMRAYGAACAAAEREACAKLCETANVAGAGMFRRDLAARIRERARETP